MQITIDIPDEYAQRLAPQIPNLSRRLLETVVVEAYKADHLTQADVGKILNLETPQVNALLALNAQALSIPSTETSRENLLTELAIALFQQERITLGTASQLANLNQIEFQQLIASRNIPIHYDIQELEQDLQSLKQEGW